MSYQRPLNQKRVNEIVDGWDPLMVHLPRVSHRVDGQYYIVDGQHTVAGFKRKMGVDAKILCHVFEGLTLEKEAEMFYEQNRHSSRISAQDKFKARLCAKEPVAVEMTRVVRSVGMTISPHKGIGAVAALETVHSQYRSLQKTLLVLKDWAAKYPDRDVFSPVLLKSTGAFFHQYPHALLERVKEVLRGTDPDALLASIRHEQRQTGDGHEPAHVVGGQMLRNRYNKNLKNARKLLSWHEKTEEAA